MLTLISRSSEHILFCGDGQKLYDEVAPNTHHTLVFDPPWNVASDFCVTHSDNVLAFCDGFRAGDIVRLFGPPTWVFAWDCVTSWYTPNRPLRRMKMCFWYGDINGYNPEGYLYGDPCGKPRLVKNTRGSYLFEPGEGKHLSDIFSSPITSLHAAPVHRHSKPFDWVCALIANTIRAGDVILDPFAGSGVTLSAARRIGARWIGSEIDMDTARQCGISPLPDLPKKQYQLSMFNIENQN